MPSNPAKNKYKPRKDGLFHCKDYPVNGKSCNFVHQRASSLGRHRRTHEDKPWTYKHKAKESVNVQHHSNSHQLKTQEADPVTIAFLAGQIKAIIDNAASIAEASPAEITHGVFALLQPGSLRKVRRHS